MKKPSKKAETFGWLFTVLGIIVGVVGQRQNFVGGSFNDYLLSILFVVFLGLGILLLIYNYIIRGILHSFKVRKISSNGIKAAAVITEIEMGGKMDGLGNEFYPAVMLKVLVNGENGEKFSTHIDTTIATTHMSRFQPGAEIDIIYNPADLQVAVMLTPTK